MTVKKKGRGRWAVVHCRGRKKEKAIAIHTTKKKAMAQHRAIQANKRRKK